MAAGCPEKLDKEFIRWILFDGRNAEKRRGWQAAAAAYPAKTRIFRRQRQVDACLRRLGGETAVPPSRHVAG